MLIRRSFRFLGVRRLFSGYSDKDLYAILGVTPTTSKKDIKQAYATLVKKHHPDVKKGDDSMFKDINLAYSTLSNDEKKKEYDQFQEQKSKIKDFQSGGGKTYYGVSAK